MNNYNLLQLRRHLRKIVELQQVISDLERQSTLLHDNMTDQEWDDESDGCKADQYHFLCMDLEDVKHSLDSHESRAWNRMATESLTQMRFVSKSKKYLVKIVQDEIQIKNVQ